MNVVWKSAVTTVTSPLGLQTGNEGYLDSELNRALLSQGFMALRQRILLGEKVSILTFQFMRKPANWHMTQY